MFLYTFKTEFVALPSLKVPSGSGVAVGVALAVPVLIG